MHVTPLEIHLGDSSYGYRDGAAAGPSIGDSAAEFSSFTGFPIRRRLKSPQWFSGNDQNSPDQRLALFRRERKVNGLLRQEPWATIAASPVPLIHWRVGERCHFGRLTTSTFACIWCSGRLSAYQTYACSSGFRKGGVAVPLLSPPAATASRRVPI